MPEQPTDQTDTTPTEPTNPYRSLSPEQEATMLAAQENAASPAKMAPPPKRKSGGIVKLVIALVVIGLLAGGGYYWAKQRKNQPSKTASVTTPEQTATTPTAPATPFEQIDQQLVSYKDGSDTVDKDNDSYKQVAFEFNDQHNFSMTKPKQQQTYKLADAPASNAGQGDYCSTLNNQWQSKVTDAQKIFEDAEYTVTATKAYVQYNDCGKLLIASSDSEVCSLYYGLGGSAQTLFISVACIPKGDLKDSLAQATEIYTILTDVGREIQPSTQLVPGEAMYLKDSQTDGYKIAELSAPERGYYYQATGQKWHAASKDGTLSCTTADKTVKFAFKGQVCTMADGSEGTVE